MVGRVYKTLTCILMERDVKRDVKLKSGKTDLEELGYILIIVNINHSQLFNNLHRLFIIYKDLE